MPTLTRGDSINILTMLCLLLTNRNYIKCWYYHCIRTLRYKAGQIGTRLLRANGLFKVNKAKTSRLISWLPHHNCAGDFTWSTAPIPKASGIYVWKWWEKKYVWSRKQERLNGVDERMDAITIIPYLANKVSKSAFDQVSGIFLT